MDKQLSVHINRRSVIIDVCSITQTGVILSAQVQYNFILIKTKDQLMAIILVYTLYHARSPTFF